MHEAQRMLPQVPVSSSVCLSIEHYEASVKRDIEKCTGYEMIKQLLFKEAITLSQYTLE